MNRDRIERLWLRQHGASEQRLARPIKAFLDAQAQRLARAIEDAGHLSTSIVPLILRPHAENDKLLKAVAQSLFRTMGLGASLELDASQSKSFNLERSKLPGDLPDGILAEFNLPAPILRAIRDALDTVIKQPYWLAVQAATTDKLESIIGDGIASGTPLRQVVQQVRDSLGGASASKRAKRIARTETTGALNAGHWESRKELIREGLVKGSEWLGVQDERQRPTHAELDGKVIGAGEQFNVGGEQAPYPGYFGLSAAQRVNCRCTTVAAGTFAD